MVIAVILAALVVALSIINPYIGIGSLFVVVGLFFLLVASIVLRSKIKKLTNFLIRHPESQSLYTGDAGSSQDVWKYFRDIIVLSVAMGIYFLFSCTFVNGMWFLLSSPVLTGIEQLSTPVVVVPTQYSFALYMTSAVMGIVASILWFKAVLPPYVYKGVND